MKLSNLKPAAGSVKKTKRIARGTGSGHGGTSTRGHKGAKARAGFKSKRAHEGGQMPLQMRLPKGGFKNTHKRFKSSRAESFVVFSLEALNNIALKYSVDLITRDFLYQNGYISKFDLVKILGDGELTKKLVISANRFSTTAKEAISKSGGVSLIEFKTSQLQAVAHSLNITSVTAKDISQCYSFFNENDKIHVVAEGSLSIKFDIEANLVDTAANVLFQNLGSNVVVLS
jgi:large subunit ribosomal protein L15